MAVNAPVAKDPDISSKEKHILIVDDDDSAREALSELLTVSGYTVACAANGQAALNEASMRLPQLILLDLVMPVMNGHAFLDLARQNSQFKHIPVIIITAHPSQVESGATAVLVKPTRPERLMSMIRRVLGNP
jgi:CheY-like chemotaxis protein